jgi:hypothetical protein
MSPKKAAETIEAYKGFNAELQCRPDSSKPPFQYEIGATYVHEGAVKACGGGFHACEHPLDVLRYYPAATSRFALVRQSGELSRDGGDTKIASARITIEAELKLPEMIKRAIDYVFARAKPEGDGSSATGSRGAASATGALFLVYRDPDDWKILHAWAGIAGQNGIKPMSWYKLGADGQPIEIDEDGEPISSEAA